MPSGFEGIFFMIQVCEEVQVYGFDPQTDPDVAYHYFDRVRGVTRVHSFPFQFDMLHALHVASVASCLSCNRACGHAEPPATLLSACLCVTPHVSVSASRISSSKWRQCAGPP